MLFATTLRRGALIAVSALAFAVGCGDAPSKGDCEKFLDHLVELEVAAGGGKAAAGDDKSAKALEDQKKAIVSAAREKFLDTCARTMPKSVVECSTRARTLEDVAKCDQGN